MVTMSAREFNQRVSAAKRAAQADIVVITERGVPSHVLLSIAEYERLRGGRSLYDALSAPAEQDPEAWADIDFEPATLRLVPRVPDL